VLRERTDRAWFSRRLRHQARKRSGSILSTPQPVWALKASGCTLWEGRQASRQPSDASTPPGTTHRVCVASLLGEDTRMPVWAVTYAYMQYNYKDAAIPGWREEICGRQRLVVATSAAVRSHCAAARKHQVECAPRDRRHTPATNAQPTV